MVFVLMPKIFAQYGLGHVTMVFAVCWTPWLLLAADRKLDANKGVFYRFSTGLILGIILMADVRWAAYSAGFIFMYNLFLLLKDGNSDPGLKEKIYFKKVFFRLLKLILSFCQQVFYIHFNCCANAVVNATIHISQHTQSLNLCR